MPILEFSAVRSRNRIGIADEDPTPEIRAALFGYEVYNFNDASVNESGRLATTAAVIFRQASARPRQIATQLEQWAPSLLQHGCLVFIQALPAGERPFREIIVQAVKELQLPATGLTEEEFNQLGRSVGYASQPRFTPLVHMLEGPDDWQRVLSYLQQHPLGEAHTPLTEVKCRTPDGSEYPMELDEHRLLVQRAFWDSSEVCLEPLHNGLSGVAAYRAHVRQRVNQVGGQWPYRYFIKIGDRGKVATEYSKYCGIAMAHLPYHLGPRLRLERCALGYRSGIIVSDYVSGAQPIRDCARDGRAPAVIANLFNVTFRAWHNGAESSDTPLQEYLSQRIPSQIPDFRRPLIKKYGAKKSLEELGKLLVAGESRPVSLGVIHGDLHATNVLVRGGDAILIDFERVEEKAPLLRDLACLEGGLFVDGFVGDQRSPRMILDSIKCLYERKLLQDGHVSPCHPADGSAWFFDCVMQIRMQARQHELAPHQYALVLASELVRKACNAHNFDANTQTRVGKIDAKANEHRNLRVEGTPIRMEQTRAMAYVLAEWILLSHRPAKTKKHVTA